MKKLLYCISGAALIAMSACTSEPDSVSDSGNGKRVITFVGETFKSTRIEIGDKSGSTYPVLWSLGDKIGIYSTAGDVFPNASATLSTSSAGQNSGVFVLDGDGAEIETKTDLLIYYPYDNITAFSEGNLSSNIPMEQKQAAPNKNSHIGKYTLAYAKSSIDPAAADGSSATFSLTHAAAYVRFVISSSEFAAYKLNGASIWCDGEAITGDITVNTSTGAVSTATPRNYGVVTVEEPAALSSAQELWLVTLPVNLTGKDVYVSVAMTDGTKNVTIPIKVNVNQLKANAVNTITLADVSTSNNPFPWYQTEETRYLAGGYAYGTANTFIATSTSLEVNIDTRARGYFIGCEEPKYAKIIFSNSLNKDHLTVSVNGDTSADSYTDLSGNTVKIIAIPSVSNYTGWFAKIAICNADKEYLWSFNVWYVAGGVSDHTYKSGVVMDRNLGNGYAPDYDAWHGVGMYCQWGRPFGFSWGATTYAKASTVVTDLNISAKNPNIFYYYDNAVRHERDWWLGNWTGKRSDRKDDFWGNPNSTTSSGSPETGTKSIFDPCPKGYMVISPAIVQEVLAGKDMDFAVGSNMQWVLYKYDGTNYAYWPFSGLKWGSSAGNPTNQTNDILAYWSNSPLHGYGASDHYAYQLYYRGTEGTWNEGGGRATGQSVRCMKDTENR